MYFTLFVTVLKERLNGNKEAKNQVSSIRGLEGQ